MTDRIGNKAPDWGRSIGLVDLWSEVSPGLWVGGTHDDDTVDVPRKRALTGRRSFDIEDAEIGPDEFDAVVTLYAWARPVDWGVEELRWGIYDGPGGFDEETMRETVAWAYRRWKAGKRVLIRCQAGLSRSGLVAALVLVRDGMELADAVELIRSNRSRECLNLNPTFTRFLQTQNLDTWRA